MIFQLLVSAYFITAAFSIPISPHLVCEEKRWQSIFVFLATNYIAHAFTTIPFPGAKLMRHLFLSFRALLLPSIGLIEAIRSVICHFVQGGSDDLRRAVAQRALLILVKTGDITPGDIKFVAKIRSSFVEIDDICIRIEITDADLAHSHPMSQVLRRILGRRIHHGRMYILRDMRSLFHLTTNIVGT